MCLVDLVEGILKFVEALLYQLLVPSIRLPNLFQRTTQCTVCLNYNYSHPGRSRKQQSFNQMTIGNYNLPLLFARFYWLLNVTWCKLQDGYHAIAPVCVDVCPPIISVKKKQSQREKSSSRVSTFHLYYLHGRKANSFCRVQ